MIADDCLCRHQHLRHAAAARTLIPNHKDFTRIDLIVHNRRMRILLTVKHDRTAFVRPHALFTGRIFDNGSFRSQIALQHRDTSHFLRRLQRSDDILHLQAIVVQIALSDFKERIFLQLLQIFAKRLSGHRHHIQIQIICQHPLHARNAACKPEGFRQMLPARIDISDMRNLWIDLIKQLRIQLHAQFLRDCRQMDQAVGRTADRAVYDNCIAEGLRRQNVDWTDISSDELHNRAPGSSCKKLQLTHRCRYKCTARKRKPQCLRHTLHRACRTHKGAGTHRRAAGPLIIPNLCRCDRVLTLLAQRNIPGDKRGRLIRPRTHASSRHKNSRNIDPRHRL